MGSAPAPRLVMLLIAWWPLSLMAWSPAALLVGIVLLDLGGQALHVTNQSMIFRTVPKRTAGWSVCICCFMRLAAVWAVSTTSGICARDGRAFACWGSVSLLALLFWLMTGDDDDQMRGGNNPLPGGKRVENFSSSTMVVARPI
jgi:hypothetical protein